MLDSTVVIGAERQGWTVRDLLQHVTSRVGETEAVISAVSAVKRIHGIWRAKTAEAMERRREFLKKILSAAPVEPITLETARIAGKIDAEAKSQGIIIPFADLLIGASALELGYAVGTANLRHFRLIPGHDMKRIL